MEHRKGKWIKQGRIVAVLFSVGAILLAIYGSFAAYTSFSSVKRVVSTGARSDTMFGSNYLSLLNLNDENYSVKRISLAENEDPSTFTVWVCNYVWGDETLYNPKNINYKITAQLFSMDGGSLPEGITGIKMKDTPFDANGACSLKNQVLESGQARRNEYKFEIPSSLKNKVRIQIVVEPVDDASKQAVNSQKLAAVLSFAEYEVSKNWTGHFLDSQTNRTPDDYDAFNYEISGNGAGTITVTWPDSLQLSKWATNDKQVSSPYTFNVDESTSAVQFQFYRNPENSLGSKSWTDLEALVMVTFTEKVDENENTQK